MNPDRINNNLTLTSFIPVFLSSGFGPVLVSNPVAKIPAVMQGARSLRAVSGREVW